MIKIAHLYYDLMNLYGEHANVDALVRKFNKQGLEVEVTRLTKGDEINFHNYDLFYMGMGTEKNQLIVLGDIVKYKTEIKNLINDKFFIITGNSLELFGKYIENNGKNHHALGIFNFYSKVTQERLVGDVFLQTPLLKHKIIGFNNRQSIMFSKENNFFNVIKGFGNEPNSHLEGYHIRNFYGTYTVGPLLVRNPYLTDFIVKKYLDKIKRSFIEDNSDIEYIAYDEFINKFDQDKKNA